MVGLEDDGAFRLCPSSESLPLLLLLLEDEEEDDPLLSESEPLLLLLLLLLLGEPRRDLLSRDDSLLPLERSPFDFSLPPRAVIALSRSTSSSLLSASRPPLSPLRPPSSFLRSRPPQRSSSTSGT